MEDWLWKIPDWILRTQVSALGNTAGETTSQSVVPLLVTGIELSWVFFSPQLNSLGMRVIAS